MRSLGITRSERPGRAAIRYFLLEWKEPGTHTVVLSTDPTLSTQTEMAKKQTNKRKRAPARRAQQTIGRNTSMLLDKASMDHIKLMADPCGGRLVPPAYAQPGGGAIQRFRNVINCGTAAGETSGVFHWTPGINEYVSNGAATPTTAFTPAGQTMFATLQTGTGAGINSACTFRCLAACIRVITNASEMNRAGVAYAGQTDSQYLQAQGTNVTNVSQVIGGLPISSRMPAKMVEILWTPSEADQSFYTDMAGSTYSLGQSFNYSSVTFGFVGGPATTGVTVEVTGVYEINFPSFSATITSKPGPITAVPWSSVLYHFYKYISDSPVIIDTVRKGVEYLGAAASSQPGRLVASAARLALTM